MNRGGPLLIKAASEIDPSQQSEFWVCRPNNLFFFSAQFSPIIVLTLMYFSLLLINHGMDMSKMN